MVGDEGSSGGFYAAVYEGRSGEGEVSKERMVRLINLWGEDHPEFSDAFPMSLSAVSRGLSRLGYTAKRKGSGDARRAVYCGFSLKKGVFVTDDRKVVCDVEGMREYLRRSVRCEADEERGEGVRVLEPDAARRDADGGVFLQARGCRVCTIHR